MKRARPVILDPEAFAAIRYTLTRQMSWIRSIDCPFTIPTCREIYTRSAHARARLDAARAAAECVQADGFKKQEPTKKDRRQPHDNPSI